MHLDTCSSNGSSYICRNLKVADLFTLGDEEVRLRVSGNSVLK